MLQKVLIGLQALGSIIGKTGVDGKKELAVGPIAVVLCGGLLLGCAVQAHEPFSQCVQTVFNALGG